ncbi:hypothetical protein RIR_jg2243.t1 [Rhizophagus irregularis DAOM 181602=DAOM 197198]|nr:hypothetical protein RIR_jg2243.t1 [Rhizophagus irregularis DAOM 181602=DAOM 197198]
MIHGQVCGFLFLNGILKNFNVMVFLENGGKGNTFTKYFLYPFVGSESLERKNDCVSGNNVRKGSLNGSANLRDLEFWKTVWFLGIWKFK